MSEFKHLLPPSASPLERSLEEVVGSRIEAVGERPLRLLKRADICPSQWLPWLAWERHVGYWQSAWSPDTQREVVASSIAVHRKKGTLAAIRRAVAVTGLQAAIDVPRSNPAYVPHAFRVQVDADVTEPTAQNVADIRYQVDYVRPARCAYALAFNQSAAASERHDRVAALSVGKEGPTPHLFRHLEGAVATTHRRASGVTVMREAA